MLRGDRGQGSPHLGGYGVLLAIIFCTVIAGILSYSSGRESERRNNAPASYSRAAKQDAERACVGMEAGAAFECIYEKVEASQDQARGEQDLSAQQRSAFAAIFSVLISLFTLIATGIGVWYVKRTLDATLVAVNGASEANKISKDSLNAVRKLEEGKLLLIYTNARIENHLWLCTLQAANLGRSPILIDHYNSRISNAEPKEGDKTLWLSRISDVKPIIIDSQSVELIEFQWTIQDISECHFLVTRIVYSTNFRENVVKYHVVRPIIDGTYGRLCNYIFVREWEEGET